MFLYIVYMEPFLLSLGRECTGIRVADFTQLDEDYCDDVDLMVEDEADFVKVDDLFRDFEDVSGALLSRTNKSKVLGLGRWQGRQQWPLHWLSTVLEHKVFGFEICASYEQSLQRSWAVLVDKFRSTLYSFQLRALETVHQRVEVINIFASSKLWYKCQILPLPATVAQQLEGLMFQFIWRGKLEKLATHEIYNKLEDGGLGLVDIRSKADALFIKQSCRMLAETGRAILPLLLGK